MPKIHEPTERLQQIEKSLFFIVGCGRSGTTMLRTMLNSHNEICLPRETFFFSGIANRFKNVGMSDSQRLSSVAAKWWIRQMGVTEESLAENLEGREATWKNIFLSLLATTAAEETAICFGEKTVGHIRCVDQLMSEFPSCRIVQIIRDPRASFASFALAAVGSNQVSALIRDWKFAASVDKKLSGNPRYLSIKFENLIQKTDGELRRICDHLEVEFDPAMLEFHQRTDKGYSEEQAHHQNTSKPIFTAGLEKWKKQLSSVQIGMGEHFLGEEMQRLGYEMIGQPVAFPVARLLFSRVLDSLSRYFIRRPAALLQKFRKRNVRS